MYQLAIIVAAISLVLPNPTSGADDYGFRFVRIRFDADGVGGRSRGGAPWSHDHPTAEMHFYEALERTTQIYVEGPPLVLTLDDDRIFEYPVLYLCEPGYWEMGEADVENLREYLDRGGFILFDDFRGREELEQLNRQLRRLYPDREPVELAPDHAIWSLYYDVDPEAAPSMVSGRGFGFGPGGYEDRYYALFDDDDRMVALLLYNQDIGDGWEWPERNIEQASTIAFQMGVNFVLYALTH